MILGVLYIYLKDIDHLWDVLRLFLFWTSGVFLRGEQFLEFFPPLLYLNPIVGILINARKILFNLEPLDFELLIICFIYGLFIFFVGNYVFKKYSGYALEKY